MRRGMKPTQAMGLKRKRGVSCRLTSQVLLIGAHLCLRLDTIASEERHLAPLTGKAQKCALSCVWQSRETWQRLSTNCHC
ncbi:hypothetical protein JG688_00012055 [Phytophthora aleatoria]|uniref:Uncharacterized protein n=1 Tax=Phytophthora aleatoria TaxID=2496075 RepID=A0A8J5J377_9STRA|nr:hypothetical protein JG688_00012055 [Phytophthora aleatoria]